MTMDTTLTETKSHLESHQEQEKPVVHTAFLSSSLLPSSTEKQGQSPCGTQVLKYNGWTPGSVKFNNALVKATMLHLLSI